MNLTYLHLWEKLVKTRMMMQCCYSNNILYPLMRKALPCPVFVMLLISETLTPSAETKK
jgi:hypothetical protein